MCCFRSLTLVIFIGIILAKRYDHTDGVNQIGFIIIYVLQPIIVKLYTSVNLLYPLISSSS